MTGAEALRAALPRLQNAGIERAGRDLRLLLAFAIGIPPDRVTLVLDDPLSDAAAVRFEAAVQARVSRQPVSQIVGGRQFWGRWFRVTPDVLDPRPETENLIAGSGNRIRGHPDHASGRTALGHRHRGRSVRKSPVRRGRKCRIPCGRGQGDLSSVGLAACRQRHI
jgi:methylase of polypeptide subunit release factors